MQVSLFHKPVHTLVFQKRQSLAVTYDLTLPVTRLANSTTLFMAGVMKLARQCHMDNF